MCSRVALEGEKFLAGVSASQPAREESSLSMASSRFQAGLGTLRPVAAEPLLWILGQDDSELSKLFSFAQSCLWF